MRWPEDAAGWPLAEHSRRILHRPHRWHVQQIGTGPVVLLLHGAGGSTHSWRDLIPLLAQDYRVIALDLPGQGFSSCGAQDRCGLAEMAQDIASLSRAQGWDIAATIGHSAGAAIALQLQLTPGFPRGTVVGINPALAPFDGVAGWLFPKLAKALSMTPFAASAFAATAGRESAARNLIAGTGSTLSPEGVALYARLLRDRAHVDGTLSMMAHWSLDDLRARLGQIAGPVLFLLGGKDRAVPPASTRKVTAQMPVVEIQEFEACGHLLHEEMPTEVVRVFKEFQQASGFHPTRPRAM